MKDKIDEEFEVIRGSIAWPHGNIPGLILIGGLLREREVIGTIKIFEEMSFRTLAEAEKIFVDGKAKYFSTLYCIYYQKIPEDEGFVQYFKDSGLSFIRFEPVLHTGNIEYCKQLVNSYDDDKKLKVPGEGFLAKELQTRRENISSEKDLHGTIALACLIAGIRGRSEEYDLKPWTEEEPRGAGKISKANGPKK